MNNYTVKADPAAQARLEAYFNEIVDLRRTGDYSDVSQYASRWGEQAARIALVLHAGLHGADAHQHELAVETAENAVKLAKWFAAQQLGILAKGRRQAATKKEEEVLELFAERQRKNVDYITARDVYRARICSTPEAAAALLGRMEQDGILVGEDVRPPHGGKTTRIFRKTTNHGT